MKKTILMMAVTMAMISCGSEEAAEPTKELSFCECIEAKGPPPAGCSHMQGLSEEEFNIEYNKCKEAEAEAETVTE